MNAEERKVELEFRTNLTSAANFIRWAMEKKGPDEELQYIYKRLQERALGL